MGPVVDKAVQVKDRVTFKVLTAESGGKPKEITGTVTVVADDLETILVDAGTDGEWSIHKGAITKRMRQV